MAWVCHPAADESPTAYAVSRLALPDVVLWPDWAAPQAPNYADGGASSGLYLRSDGRIISTTAPEAGWRLVAIAAP